MPSLQSSLINRVFVDQVDLSNLDGCWPWKGKGERYGNVMHDRRSVGVHRASYETFKGEIPEGLMVRHTCDNTRCVNPAHLLLGTSAQNSADAVERGRQAHHETHGRAKLSRAVVEEIRWKWLAGKNKKDLGIEYSVSHTQITRILTGRSWRGAIVPVQAARPRPQPTKARVGSANPKSHLTEDDVREIRRQHAAGLAYGTLARWHKVTPATIANIVLRKTWKHVP